MDGVRVARDTAVVDQIAARQPDRVQRQFVADVQLVEVPCARCAPAVVSGADVSVGTDRPHVSFRRFVVAEDVDVVHHHLADRTAQLGVDLVGGDPDDRRVHGVDTLARGIGHGVGHGDQVFARDPADTRQLHVRRQFVAGDDRAVLLEDLLGLDVGVVSDDDLLEQLPVRRHRRDGGEGERRDETGIAKGGCGFGLPVGAVVVLDRACVLTHLLAADLIRAVEHVVVADAGSDPGGIVGGRGGGRRGVRHPEHANGVRIRVQLRSNSPTPRSAPETFPVGVLGRATRGLPVVPVLPMAAHPLLVKSTESR